MAVAYIAQIDGCSRNKSKNSYHHATIAIVFLPLYGVIGMSQTQFFLNFVNNLNS